MLDYYKILGISRNASREDIRRAYHHRAKMFHPDVNSSSKSIERFQAIGKAYETLIDPEKQRKYDLILKYGYEHVVQAVKGKKSHPDPKYRHGPRKRSSEFAGYTAKRPVKKDRVIIVFENILFFSLLLIGLAAVWFAGNELMSESYTVREHGMTGMIFGVLFLILLLLGWKFVMGRKFRIKTGKF